MTAANLAPKTYDLYLTTEAPNAPDNCRGVSDAMHGHDASFEKSSSDGVAPRVADHVDVAADDEQSPAR